MLNRFSMLLKVRARTSAMPLATTLTTLEKVLSCFSLAFLFSTMVQISRTRIADSMIRPPSIVDMTAAKAAAMIRAATTGDSSLRITVKKAELPEAP